MNTRIQLSVAILAIGAALIVFAVAQPAEVKNEPSAFLVSSNIILHTPPQQLVIATGLKSPIVIHSKDGRVEYPDDLDAASKQFWDSVGNSFSAFRESVIAGYKAAQKEERMKETKWVGIELGLRSDGVLVGRELKQ